MTFLNPRDVHAPAGPYSHTAVVKLGVFVLPGQDFQVLRAVRERHCGTHRPTSTTVCVPQLASPAFLVEVEAIAVKRAR